MSAPLFLAGKIGCRTVLFRFSRLGARTGAVLRSNLSRLRERELGVSKHCWHLLIVALTKRLLSVSMYESIDLLDAADDQLRS